MSVQPSLPPPNLLATYLTGEKDAFVLVEYVGIEVLLLMKSSTAYLWHFCALKRVVTIVNNFNMVLLILRVCERGAAD